MFAFDCGHGGTGGVKFRCEYWREGRLWAPVYVHKIQNLEYVSSIVFDRHGRRQHMIFLATAWHLRGIGMYDWL